MGKAGKRSQKGQAETDWGEPKSAQINLSITPTGKRLLNELVDKLGISRAEILEQVARGTFCPEDLVDFLNQAHEYTDLEVLALSRKIGVSSERLMIIRDCLQSHLAEDSHHAHP